MDIQTNIHPCAQGKEELSGGVETRMAGPGLAAIAGLEQLTGWQALALHGLADDRKQRHNAELKDLFLVLFDFLASCSMSTVLH